MKISVVMVTYNGARFLRDQLDSILSQSFMPYEIVIQDDKSTDNTWSILNDYSKKYAIIKLYQNNINLGVNQNFLSAFSKTSGDYIAICDQDDVWAYNKLECFRYAIENNDHKGNITLVFSDSYICDYNLNVTEQTFRKADSTIYDSIWWGLAPGHCIIFKKKILYTLKNLKEIDFIYEWLIGITAMCNGEIKKINIPLTYHRRHSTTITNLEYKPPHVEYKPPIKLIYHVFRDLSAKCELKNFKWQFENILLILRNFRETYRINWICRFLYFYKKETFIGMTVASFIYFFLRSDLELKNRVKAFYIPIYKYYFYKRDGAGLRGPD